MAKVLVTGGAGFVASWCVVRALEAGHTVRATLRRPSRADEVRAMVRRAGWSGPDEALAFAAADLERDAGWAEAADGCELALHVASPFPAGVPRDPDELIRPAREGALRVLRACRDAGVRRVVLTSSFAAVGYGHADPGRPFTEADWTEVERPEVGAYPQSKTLAERAAWAFVGAEGRGMELATVNPVAVFGPALGPDLSTSLVLIRRLLEGSVPGVPRMRIGVVDVRDVADLHLLALAAPAAAGERFLAISGPTLALADIARTLREGLGPRAGRVPRRELPDALVRLVGRLDPQIRQVAGELGRYREASAAKAETVLGWRPRPARTAILDAAQSLFDLGVVGGRRG